MKIFESPQGSDEWRKERSKHFTASNFSDLFMSKSTQGYNDIINQVAFERITDSMPEEYSNDYMKRGIELESFAREAYELQTFNKVTQVGFIELDEWIGASVDGLVGSDGLLEIKCPKWSTLMSYILNDSIPKGYIYQIQGQLYVTERSWCDFYAWHPTLKPFLRRVPRDEAIIAEIQTKLTEAIEEAKRRIERISIEE